MASTAGVKRSFATMAMESDPLLTVDGRYGDTRSQVSSRHASGQNSVASERIEEQASPQNSASPSPIPQFALRTPPLLDPDASIVLVGIRGAGKSTLAVIASSAMKRRIVEAERSFQETTGLFCTAYKKTHGLIALQRRQAEVLNGILRAHQRNCIIVCNWMDHGVCKLLAKFAATHLVIHVVRDSKGIQEHLKILEEDKVAGLLDVSASFFRSCSNYEYFNMSESLPRADSCLSNDQLTSEDLAHGQRLSAPSLTLKRAERHFLKFLSLITPKGTIPFVESAYPLSVVPTEERCYTYALVIPLSRLSSGQADVETMATGADAIEMVIETNTNGSRGRTSLEAGRLASSRASEISQAFAEIRRNAVIPIIYHVPFSMDISLGHINRPLYVEYLRHGLSLAAEYMTVDLRMDDVHLSQVVRLKGKTKIIGTLDISDETPPGWNDSIWLSTYERARKLDCDLVRFTKPAVCRDDNFEVQRLMNAVKGLRGSRIPVIAYNTGRLGRTSACFNEVMTAVVPESPAQDHVEESQIQSYRLPCITARQATEALYASFVFDRMRAYVIGGKVDYSLSPAMHNAAFKACGIPYHYKPHSTPSLSSIHSLVNDPYFAGSSVGRPFKVEIIALTHSLSRHARAIGAVNTLIPVRRLNDDGSIPENALLFSERSRAGPVRALYGDNTDWIGIRACIRRGLSPANAVKSTSSCLIIGAGGMARAAVYAMLQLGVKNVIIFNRTVANAEKLVAHFNKLLSRNDLHLLNSDSDAKTTFYILKSREDPWPETLRPPTMVISCIPTHAVSGNPSPEFTLPPQWHESPTGGVVLELDYKSVNTPLLEQIRAETHRGWVPMDGFDLLPEQGFAQFELFTGRRAPRRLMRDEVVRCYRDELKSLNLAQVPSRVSFGEDL